LSAILSQKPLPTNASKLQMLSFYHFSPLDNPLAVRDELFQRVSSIPGLRGTIYLAPEGINAQLAVPCGEPLQDLVEICRATLPFDPLQENLPNLGDLVDITTPTFDKLVVRARDAILRDGMDETLDWTDAGSELSPGEWDHQLRSEANKPLVLLDCRNLYEFVQGTFHGATPLMTSNFQESWSELKERTQGLSKDQPLHIFCTGGIRCVKVGAYLKQKLGFSDIRRLEHGIIGYQRWSREEHLLSDESLWFGENFLFDKRRFHKRESD
jgi:predicted sulfurtransferase